MTRVLAFGVVVLLLGTPAMCQLPNLQGPDCPLDPVSGANTTFGAGENRFANLAVIGKVPTKSQTEPGGGDEEVYSAGAASDSDATDNFNISGLAANTAPVFFNGMLAFNPSVSASVIASGSSGAWWSYGLITEYGALLGVTRPVATSADPPGTVYTTLVLQSIASATAMGMEDGPFGNAAYAISGQTSVTVLPGSSFYSRAYLDSNNNYSQQYEFGTGLAGHTAFGDEYVIPGGAGQPATDSLGLPLEVVATISCGLFQWSGSHSFSASAMADAVVRSFQVP